MSSSTSIGRGPAHGSNENHDGDPMNKTLGEKAGQEEAPAGSDLVDEEADVPAGVPGAKAKPEIDRESPAGG